VAWPHLAPGVSPGLAGTTTETTRLNWVPAVVAVAQPVRALDCGEADEMREHDVMLPHRFSWSTDSRILRHPRANNGKHISRTCSYYR